MSEQNVVTAIVIIQIIQIAAYSYYVISLQKRIMIQKRIIAALKKKMDITSKSEEREI